MRHCPEYGDAEAGACIYIARAVKTADNGRSRSIDAGGLALGAAQAEFHERIVARGGTDTARLSSDKAFMIHDHGHARFQNKGFRLFRFHPQKHFLRKGDRPFRHGVNIAGKTQCAQVC